MNGDQRTKSRLPFFSRVAFAVAILALGLGLFLGMVRDGVAPEWLVQMDEPLYFFAGFANAAACCLALASVLRRARSSPWVVLLISGFGVYYSGAFALGAWFGVWRFVPRFWPGP
jgi:hypothetical protein